MTVKDYILIIFSIFDCLNIACSKLTAKNTMGDREEHISQLYAHHLKCISQLASFIKQNH